MPTSIRSDDYDVVIVAGGASSRLGGLDKAGIVVGGKPLLLRTVEAAGKAQKVIVVGPANKLATFVNPGSQYTNSRRIEWRAEEPPGGGPLAAAAAGFAATESSFVVLLACDMPLIGGAIEPLLIASRARGAAAIDSGDGTPNLLASAWDRNLLQAALTTAGDPHDRPMRLLTEHVTVHLLNDKGNWTLDCDTPESLRLARQAVLIAINGDEIGSNVCGPSA